MIRHCKERPEGKLVLRGLFSNIWNPVPRKGTKVKSRLRELRETLRPWCGWGKGSWGQVRCRPLQPVAGGSLLPLGASLSGRSPFLGSFCAPATLANSLWLAALGNCFSLLSREKDLLQAAPNSHGHCCWLGMLSRGGWPVRAGAGRRKGWWLAASHAGRVFTQKCHRWVFQEREMAPCRIQEENVKVFPLPPIINLKWPKEEVLSAHKNVWLTEKPRRQQHFTGLYRGSALVKDLPVFMHCPTNLN